MVAGPGAMPGSHAQTPLKDLLPVTFPPDAPAAAGESVGGFTIALTAEGLDSVVMHQHVDADRSRGVWQSLPALHWRSAGVAARPGATVLASARPGLRRSCGTRRWARFSAMRRRPHGRSRCEITSGPTR
ncbi:MAG: hypothetical protein NT031_19625 [Planctomycetota bacterium]|nr:hypothetical protein [Planctomycetota bacterium]